jgi:hypothetical protein
VSWTWPSNQTLKLTAAARFGLSWFESLCRWPPLLSSDANQIPKIKELKPDRLYTTEEDAGCGTDPSCLGASRNVLAPLVALAANLREEAILSIAHVPRPASGRFSLFSFKLGPRLCGIIRDERRARRRPLAVPARRGWVRISNKTVPSIVPASWHKTTSNSNDGAVRADVNLFDQLGYRF